MSGATMSLGQITRTVPARDRIAAALSGKPAKWLARVTGKTPKAAEKWKAADNAMTVDALFALAREMDEVWEIVKAECGRADSDAEAMLQQMRELLAVRQA